MTRLAALTICALLVTGTSCEREARRPHRENLSELAMGSSNTPLVPGPMARQASSTEMPVPARSFEDNAFEVARGQQLYINMNCVGCHAHGGGGMGPPLMDDEWLYGSEPDHVYKSIVEGRPNGMPSFRGKMTGRQVWQLVAYVRSMSGQLRKDVSPGRTDSMQVKKPELAKEKETPTRQEPGANQKERER